MKNGFAILITLLFLLAGMYSFAQRITYSGTVTYYKELIKIAKGGGTDDGYNWMVNIDEKQIIKGVFNVAFSAPVSGVTNASASYQLSEVNENFDITMTSNNEAHEERVSQSCPGEYNKPKDSWGKPNVNIVKPGDAYSVGSEIHTSRIDPQKPAIDAGWLMIRGNEFNLMLKGKMKLQIESESYSKQNLVCLPESPPAKSISNTQEMEWPILVSGKGILENPKSIKGFLVPVDISNEDCSKCTGTYASFVHGDLDCAYLSKTTIDWDLTRNCEFRESIDPELDKRNISTQQKNRIREVLNKLEDPGTSQTHVFLGWDLLANVKTEDQAKEILNNKDNYMDDIRKLFDRYCEKSKGTSDFAQSVITTDQTIVNIINRFNLSYLQEHILSPGQVTIKDWIADQQLDPTSIYSCYANN